jgi:hypothetical protein
MTEKTHCYPYVWAWRLARKGVCCGLSEVSLAAWVHALGERKGMPCRVLVRARAMRSVLVEFADGYRMVTSVRGLRRVIR